MQVTVPYLIVFYRLGLASIILCGEGLGLFLEVEDRSI